MVNLLLNLVAICIATVAVQNAHGKTFTRMLVSVDYVAQHHC